MACRWQARAAPDQGASSAASRPPNCPVRGAFLLWDSDAGGRTGARVNGLPVETNTAPACAVAAGGLRRRPPSCEDGAATSFPEQPFGRFVNRPYGCVRDGGSKPPPYGYVCRFGRLRKRAIRESPLRVCAGRREQAPALRVCVPFWQIAKTGDS